MPTNSNNQRASATRRRAKTGRPDKEILADIIRRVVDAAQPQKIILFGSAARCQMGPNSDIDLLVIKAGRFNRVRVVEKIYRGLHGAGEAVDAIVVTPEEVERYRDTHCLVICPALKEGKVVYAA